MTTSSSLVVPTAPRLTFVRSSDETSEPALSPSETVSLLDHDPVADPHKYGDEGQGIREGFSGDPAPLQSPAKTGGRSRRHMVLALLAFTIVSALAVAMAPSLNQPDHQESLHSLSLRLRGKRVVMIGDSIMRYRYMTLTSFLSTGVPLSTLPNANSSTSQHNRVIEGTWNGWSDFYANNTLEDESCDCWRADGVGDSALMKENRHYTRDGWDISYFQLFRMTGTCTLHGHDESHHTASPVDTEYDWCYSIGGFMQHLVRNVPPDVLFINTGLWAAASTEFIAAVEAALPLINQVVWFPTTQTRDLSTLQDFDAPMTSLFANHSNAAIADTWTITNNLLATMGAEAAYWDRVHSYAFVYEMTLVDALLHVN
jgi:hypothetical protein